jgi:hypothetical protein
MLTFCRIAAACLAGLLFAATAAADEQYVDLQLVLAVDVSGSMDYGEQRIQRDGYISAFRHPDVLQVITSGPYGRIAVTYVQWAGAFSQEVVVPWTIIANAEDAETFARALEHAPITQERGTSISMALLYASTAFEGNDLKSLRQTIDISGDGANNDGLPVAGIRSQVLAKGITINGLPLVLNPSRVGGLFIGLDTYYEACVIGGPGAFSIPVTNMDTFGQAIRRKLILEIAASEPPPVEPRIVPVGAPASALDCALTERSPRFVP